eukprot:TRINITY_DN3770_c0_g1_i2.p1 TRINITY_DN3770_c0_g1~~TRINITY_DN3770_c0_g1_i2.p1  ORF type:complete len:745 (-),score=182.72 TRINITY_DN3770_c0_g1_i2:154-2388(-)
MCIRDRYQRRFTRMPWWPKIKLMYERGYLRNLKDYQLYLKAPPITPQEFQLGVQKKKGAFDLYDSLYENLLKNYPDLKYISMQQAPKLGENISQDNFVLLFIQKQKSLIQAGYTVEKSFEMTEKQFQERIQRRLNDSILNRTSAISNKMRSLLNYYQQRSEHEARHKVLRMERDLPLFRQAKLEEKLAQGQPLYEEEEGEHEFDEQFDEESEITKESVSDVYGGHQQKQADQSAGKAVAGKGQSGVGEEKDLFKEKYERVLTAIVQKPFNEEKRKHEEIQEFLSRTKHMMKLYYERAAVEDRLSGLTDEEILSKIRESPSKIKSRSRQLLRRLEKHGVRLDENGEVDYSQCTKPYIVEKFKSNPLVKMVLMHSSLDFEFPHKEHQRQMANELRKEVEQRRQEQKEQQQSELTQEEVEEQNQDEDKFDSNNIKIMSFNEQIRFDYGIQQTDGRQRQAAKDQTEKKGRTKDNLKVVRDGEEIDISQVLYPQAVYRLFENNEERMARLEEKWLKVRLASLESNLEKPTMQEQSETLQKVVDKVRRIKWRVDQQMQKNAEKLLFEEHMRFTQDELMADEEVYYEMLDFYLKQSEEAKKDTPRKELDDERIMKTIKRRQLVEDIVKPFQDSAMLLQDENDVKEVRRTKEREINQEKIREYITKLEDTAALGSSRGEQDFDDDLFVEKSLTEDKEQRQKIVEYIKKQSAGVRTDTTTPAPGQKGQQKSQAPKVVEEKGKKGRSKGKSKGK